ncbi:MAG TPA: BON domain-containing protein [Vicinamibacterales bacterium]|nr:BON domain-containing protein [Vicinamibacterales bacterium]
MNRHWLAIATGLGIVFAVFALAAPARAQVERSDRQLLHDVIRRVNDYTRLTVFDNVGVAVRDGVVTLTGKVTMPYKRDDLGKRVLKVPGVRSVLNQIGVLPVSQDDNQLRYRIASAIYGNPSFWEYASLANPPIHIIVDNGRVTLVGVVRSDVERVLARSLASVFGVMSLKNDLKTEAELRAEEDVP